MLGEKSASPVIGIVTMIVVVVGISAISSVTVFDLTNSGTELPDASFRMETVSSGEIKIEVYRNENVDKFILSGTAISDSKTVEEQIWQRDFVAQQDGKVQLIGVVEGDKTLIGSEKVVSGNNFSGSSTVIAANGNLLGSDGGSLYQYSFDLKVLAPPRVNYVGSGPNLPGVNQNGDLVVISDNGTQEILVESSDPNNPRTQKSRFSVFSWNGSDNSIFYVSNDKKIYRADEDKTTHLVKNPDNGANAVVGSFDYDGDSSKELVFADGSQQLRYIEPNGDTNVVSGGQTGSNNGIGSISSVADFNNDGKKRIAVVDGGNDIVILSGSESNQKISKVDAVKSPITIADVNKDGKPEIVYTGKDSGYIKYINDPLDSKEVSFLLDETGDRINGSDTAGLVSG